MPPEKYFDEHPEYFSLVQGRRRKDQSQLCCTNPDVIRICTEAIREAMRQQPQATVFSVSQNDWDNHCECPNCQELARAEGSQMAPVLQLVNRVAEAVEKEFPDKIVETLAYQWTRRPPKTMRPRPNVVIRLCSIECCFSHPLATCDGKANKAFRADLEAWAKVAPRLWVWDYATDFRHYLLPFPNQRVRGPNVRFYVAHNVKGIFEQDTYDTPHRRAFRAGRIHHGQVPLESELRPERRDERVSRSLLRQGGRADPRLSRPAPRPRRTRKHPRGHLRGNRQPAPDRRPARTRPTSSGSRPRRSWRASRTFSSA